MNNRRLFWIAALGVGVVMGLAGCVCICKENRKSGIPIIVCQPEDVTVEKGKPAKLAVTAKGKGLRYQWYFNDKPVKTKEGQSSTYVESGVTEDAVGFYSVEIIGLDEFGTPIANRSRAAALGLGGPMMMMSSGTNSYPPQTQPVGSPQNPVSGPCGSYCSYVNYNNGGNGFAPAVGSTEGVAKLRSGSTTGPYIPNTNYDLLWRVSATERGCATNRGTIEKVFAATNPKKYFLTVYFRPGNCPAANTKIILELLFQ